MKLPVIYQDQHFFALNKPCACHSVKNARSDEMSVAAYIELNFPAWSKSSPNANDCGLINRLDYMTSGVLIGAKTKEAWRAGRALFSNGQVSKKYIAVLQGNLKRSRRIEAFIGTPKRRAKKVRVYSTKPGKAARALEASLYFEVVKHQRDWSLVEVSTSTGRRHQVRALAAALGHPLYGDELYGAQRPADGQARFYLHASGLEFVNPLNTRKVSIRAALPRWPAAFNP